MRFLLTSGLALLIAIISTTATQAQIYYNSQGTPVRFNPYRGTLFQPQITVRPNNSTTLYSGTVFTNPFYSGSIYNNPSLYYRNTRTNRGVQPSYPSTYSVPFTGQGASYARSYLRTMGRPTNPVVNPYAGLYPSTTGSVGRRSMSFYNPYSGSRSMTRGRR